MYIKLLAVSALVLSANAALADSFYSSSVSTPGNPATQFIGYSATAPVVPPNQTGQPTYSIGTGGVWAGPVGPSSWVSYNPNTAPGGSVVAPDGYYDYEINLPATFTPGLYSLTVLADDTASVYLNSAQLIPEGSGPYPQCAVGLPNCLQAYTFTFNSGSTPVLDFEVHQAGAYSTGLDFYGQAVTPEPSSIALLGTGLLGVAGTLRKRFAA